MAAIVVATAAAVNANGRCPRSGGLLDAVTIHAEGALRYGASVTDRIVKAVRSEMTPAAVSSGRKAIALVVAGIADAAQLGFFPVFGEGALSIPDDVLDVVVAVILLVTLGFRWRLAISLAIELIPGATLFPTWTAVVVSLPTAPKQLVAPDRAPRG